MLESKGLKSCHAGSLVGMNADLTVFVLFLFCDDQSYNSFMGVSTVCDFSLFHPQNFNENTVFIFDLRGFKPWQQ
jgi:hypothetical protein